MDETPLTDAALDAWIDAGTVALGIGMQPDWRAAIRLHMRISLGHAAAMQGAPLSDRIDPAPVFRA